MRLKAPAAQKDSLQPGTTRGMHGAGSVCTWAGKELHAGKRFKSACASGSFPVALSLCATPSDLHSLNPTFASWENPYKLLLILPEALYAPLLGEASRDIFWLHLSPTGPLPTTPPDPRVTAPITPRGSFRQRWLVPQLDR